MSLTLYYHPLSSYCHKALIALYENGTSFEKRFINLGDAADRAALESIWPIAKFPVLSDAVRNRDIPEATLIIEYADHYYPGAQPLVPRDWDEALEVRLWDRFFDNYVHTPMQQIVADRMSGSKADLASQRRLLRTAYDMLDSRLARRDWVAAKQFSLADCAAAPALFYGSILQPFPEQCTHLHGYFERLVNRASCRRVLEEAKPFFQYFPFAEALPARFR
jgi:glutathione S-transferase